MGRLVTRIEGEFAGRGNGWTPFVDLAGEIRLRYGINGVGPNDRTAGTGTLMFGLDNSAKNSETKLGLYSPNHTNRKAGFKLGMGVRLALSPEWDPAAIASSAIGSPTVVTTAAAHGLTTGDRVEIAGHLGPTSINGFHSVTVLSPTTFSVPVSSSAPVPSFHADGGFAVGTGAVTPSWPTHQAGDVALLFVESCGGEAATLSTPAGFVEIASSPQATGAGTAGTRLTVFWCRATSGAMSNPTVADPGDHVYARILTYRGCVETGDPWDAVAGAVHAAAVTTTTWPSVTTTVANCLVVLAATRDTDSTAAHWDPAVNAALSSIAERVDGGTTNGNGGGLAVLDGGKAAAGATGTTTAAVLSSINAMLTIALKPAGAGGVMGTGGTFAKKNIYYKFSGTLDVVKPSAGLFTGDLISYCTAVDWMNDAARLKVTGLSVQTNKRSDELFTLLINSLPTPPLATEVQIGQDTYAYAFDNTRDEADAVLTELQRLATSELGYIYIKGDRSQGGTLVYESRRTRALAVSNTDTFTDVAGLAAIEAEHSRADVINKVQITTHPRRIDVSAVVLAKLENSVAIGANASITILQPYRDPNQEAARVGGTDMIAPVAVTDYAGNTVADGSGTNITGSLTVVANYGGNGVRWTITNNGSVNGFITLLQARGKGVYDFQQNVLEAEDLSSQVNYGEGVASIDMPYQSDAAVAAEASLYLVNLYKDPTTNVRNASMFSPATDVVFIERLLRREISDRVGVVEQVTGVKVAVGSVGYFINAVDLVLDERNNLSNQWLLAPADKTSYWLLEVPGRSELDSTTVLGFGQIIGHTDAPHCDTHDDVAHADVAHADVTHGDTAHGDAGHGDTAHTDVSHSDSHGDQSHQDQSHQDQSHQDSHQDVSHQDTAHSDVAHGDEAHADQAHSDNHLDGFDEAHIDNHGDIPHGDSAHNDSPHSDSHDDVAHTDSHSDQSHQDVSHQDQSHSDSHSDTAHQDVAHSDGGHQDAGHADSAHQDVNHSDVTHVDDHCDVAHGDI